MRQYDSGDRREDVSGLGLMIGEPNENGSVIEYPSRYMGPGGRPEEEEDDDDYDGNGNDQTRFEGAPSNYGSRINSASNYQRRTDWKHPHGDNRGSSDF